MKAVGVAVGQDCGQGTLAGDWKRLWDNNRLGEIALTCGEKGSGELALLAALGRMAVISKNGDSKYQGIVVECAYNGPSYAAAKSQWKTNKSLVPIGPLLASYGFELVPQTTDGSIIVGLKGNWREVILNKLLSKRYSGDQFAGMCPLSTGHGLTYCV